MRRAALLVFVAGCGPAAVAPPTPDPVHPTPVDTERLHNVFRLTDRVYSGNTPDGTGAFAELRKLGVKTIISVDGAAPDAATAAEHGMRYVHLPVGYDGIPRDTALKLAKALRDLPGPVYVHCHHGKHRGPTAVAAALMCLDPEFLPEQANAFQVAAGTDPKYRGLMEAPWTLRRPSPAELDAVPDDFPPLAEVSSLAKEMLKIDETFDRLKDAKAAKWPLAARKDAVLLAEHYRELARLPEPKRKASRYPELLAAADAAAVELERAIPEKTASDDAFAKSQAACARCHAATRD